MEYPARYDFFLSFKALFNEKEEFIDYILIDISENFKNVSNMKPAYLIGKRLSELFVDNEEDFIGAKEFYYHMVPSTMRKFEKHVDVLGRWYLISIYSDEKEYLVLFYSNISNLFETFESMKSPLKRLACN